MKLGTFEIPMDDDDRPGYLMDHFYAFCLNNGISDKNDFNEKFQSDSFQDQLNEFIEAAFEIAGMIEE